ncbi:uncharacterized protein LOC116849343 [Odontomachus brunneus]|uniref:uncharacterized protein LOC116849343 n=1 Tax=Odontomachus brunneus TaxID=486640 RepID=UPI0013F19188|nr:uncharacterized protein LOC116849343 [Odontomachus brunneus]
MRKIPWCWPWDGAGSGPGTWGNRPSNRLYTPSGAWRCPPKTEALFFHDGSRGRPPWLKLRIGGISVRVGTEMKYLGLTLDDTWGFEKHFEVLTPNLGRVAGMLGALRRPMLATRKGMCRHGPHGELTFRTTQVLTGHGCFGEYLYRIVRKECTSRCHHCSAAEDAAQHTLGECPAWEGQRRVLISVVGADLSPPVLIRATLRRREAWAAVTSFCKEVMLRKEKQERARREKTIVDGWRTRRALRPGWHTSWVCWHTPEELRPARRGG